MIDPATSRSPKRGWFRRLLRIAGWLTVIVVVLAGLYYLELTSDKSDYYAERHGTLIAAEAEPAEPDEKNRWFQDATLTSSSGLVVQLRVQLPPQRDGERVPVVLLLGGTRTGKLAVDLVRHKAPVAFAAIEYPYLGPNKIKGVRESLQAVPEIQRGVLDTPPALMLALDWLVQQPWADPARVELVGISLGVPFVAAAGANDERFSRVWFFHGGADNLAWTEFALRARVENEFVRWTAARVLLLLAYGNTLNTLESMDEIAPRPMIVVAARNDEFVPLAASLGSIADPGKAEVVWTEGPHVKPKRQDVLNELVRIMFARLEVDSGGA